ncbi:oligosaccharide flippase family protein [Vibrio cyclitrophicus]|uniref:oligosaccharide flippase family protein n=1 Tax=Vibrio cyclitrophicus TaxID=47951 RepID=UPI000C863AD6|nr:oligosaccharide flippase family protein [Vibrio cyclitrophicus]PME49115.1 hypothetical protein BCV35_11015 [Vibrio cyclitrophicus]
MNSLISKLSNKVKDPTLLLGAMSAFFVKVLAAGGAFLLNVVIARNLGAEQAGYFFLAQAICVFLASLTRQGFDNALVRFIAGFKVSDDFISISGIFKYAFLRILIVSSITALCLYIAAPWLSNTVFQKPPLDKVIYISALLIVPLSLSQFLGFCFQGLKKVVPAMFYQSGLLAILSVATLWLLMPESASQAMTVYVTCAFVVTTIGLCQWIKHIPPSGAELKIEDKRAINQAIKPLFLILLMSQTTQWAGQLMLGAWSTSEEVALFATAQRTAMLTSFILIAVNAIAAPKFAEAFKKNKSNEIKQVALSSSRLMTAVAIPILILMIVFSPWLMGLFGPSFVDGTDILRILAIGQFVNIVTGSVGYLLQMTANEHILRNNMVISSVVFVVGSVIAIPLYGVLGAAVVTAVSIATQNLLCVYQVNKLLGFNTLKIFSR